MRIATFVGMVASTVTLSAQQPDVLVQHGLVLDAATRAPIVGATLRAGSAKVVSGADGGFQLRLAAGRWTVSVAAAGYRAASLELDVPVDALTVELLPVMRFADAAEVTGSESGAAEPALVPLRPTQVMAVAGGADNVFRVLQTLPGVAATEDYGSRLAVRGGGPDQNLTVMDGVEIHNPYRLFGLTSAFNPETVQHFELLAGGFDSRYGDRLSSILIVENRSGNAQRGFTGSSALSVTDGNLVLEGALPGGKGSWLATARRTYYDLVAERFVDDDLPSFEDAQFKLDWEPRNGQRLTFSSLRSRENTDATFDGDLPAEQFDVLSQARNDLVSLAYDARLGSGARLSTIASWYRNTDRFDVDAQFQSNAKRSNAPEQDATPFANVAFDRSLSVRDASLRQELAVEVGNRHLFETGFEFHALATGVDFVNRGDSNPEAANGSSVEGGAGLPDLLDSSRSTRRGGAWLQDTFRASSRLTLKPGARVDWSGVNGEVVVAPRFSVGLRLGERTQLTGALGLYTQSPGYEKLYQSDFFVDLTDSGALSLKAERATHAVLGIERRLTAGLTARVEGYYKRFERLLVGRLETEAERSARLADYDFPVTLGSELPTEPIVTSFPTNDGTGRAWGVDFYLARRATSLDTHLTGWLSYTYGRAEREAYGRTYPFQYDRRHAGTAVLNLRAGRRWTLSTTIRVASGFPRTPPVGLRVNGVADRLDVDGDGDLPELIPERDAQGRLVYIVNLGGVQNLNSGRLPFYARIDLRASFRPRGPQGRWEFYLDLINATNRKNAGFLEAELEYDPTSDRPRLSESRSRALPLIPSVGVRFRF